MHEDFCQSSTYFNISGYYVRAVLRALKTLNLFVKAELIKNSFGKSFGTEAINLDFTTGTVKTCCYTTGAQLYETRGTVL